MAAAASAVPVAAQRHRLGAQRESQFGHRSDWLGSLGREIEFDSPAWLHVKRPLRVRNRLGSARRRETLFPEQVGAGQRRVAAQIDFDRRREPPQVKTVCAGHNEGRL